MQKLFPTLERNTNYVNLEMTIRVHIMIYDNVILNRKFHCGILYKIYCFY